MKNEAMLETDRGRVRLVTATKLIEEIWDADCRPCIRSIRTWTTNRMLPSVHVGKLIFYDVDQVKAALLKRTIKSSS